MLRDNELYRRAFKAEQPGRLVVCDYNAAEITEKVHGQFEHAGNSKTFAKIIQLYYGINKQMFEWLLKRCAVFLNHRQSNTRAPIQPVTTSGKE